MTAPDHAPKPLKTTCTKGGIHTCTNRGVKFLLWLQRACRAHEQTGTPELQDPELARLQRSAQAGGSLTVPLDPAMAWEAAPAGKRGQQPDDSDAAIQT